MRQIAGGREMPPVPSHHPIVSQAPHFSWRTQARKLIVLAALLMASAGLDIAKAGFFDELLYQPSLTQTHEGDSRIG
jgi:hypothetical protein